MWNSVLSPNDEFREQWSLFVVSFLKIQYPDKTVKGWELVDDISVPVELTYTSIGGYRAD